MNAPPAVGDETSMVGEDSSAPAVDASLVTGIAPLAALCRTVCFAPGDILRLRGVHYLDMVWLTEGTVDVHLDDGTAPGIVRHAGSPVGEIGFLRGCPATATVIARSPVRGLAIDDAALARIERDAPALAAWLLRHLAQVAEERTSENLTFVSNAGAYANGQGIEILLCRDGEMLSSAQRLRYEVYCEELGRNSPFADHDRRIITDDLDATGHTFIAVEAGQTIGTIRANLPSQGPLGVLDELYGMRASPHYPAKTAVCTKFIVRKSRRTTLAALKLVGAVARFGLSHDIRECYADCIPSLLPFYKAMGFAVAGEEFFHRENGPSHPIVIDLTTHGAKLTGDFVLYDYLRLYARANFLKWRGRP
jgi:N-acyl-L-homoserine lactone synthetase